MYPLQNPNPNPNPAHTSGPKSLSFDEVSKLFSLPLSDAADSLGVCPSVLKKLCYDNGLVRWPYRKVLAGKSIDEIKEEAVIEKNEKLAEMPGVAAERGPEAPNKTTSSLQDSSKPRIASQLQGNKNLESGSLQNSSNLTTRAQADSDEFKYGFPSDGLSTVSYRWWGNDSPYGNEMKQVCNDESLQEKKLQSEEAATSNAPDGEKSENCTGKSNDTDAQGTDSLSAIRKRALKDGKAALKLGVYRGNGVNKLDWSKRSVLVQIFRTSLPNEWDHGSS